MPAGSMNATDIRNALVTTDLVEEFSSSDRGYARGPERDLLSALLFDGIQSYLNNTNARSNAGKARYREACAWIHRRDDSYVFSFESVCEALGIDPDYLRVGLINIRTSELLKGKRRN